MKKLKNAVLKFVNKPSDGILSSQTLYESVFYLLALNTDEKDKIDRVIHKIIETQLPDGGFDIGYDFQFGPGLSKSQLKEGTSPEILSLTALCMYCDKYGETVVVKEAIELAVKWILDRVITVKDGYAIPYAPDTFKGIHITNATSFCISALAYAIPYLEGDVKVGASNVLNGMYKFMLSQLEIKGKTGYWPYFYQDAQGHEASLINDKIDNYHIAQQLYHHCLAQKRSPSTDNLQIIHYVSSYLIDLINDEGYIPYTFSQNRVSDKVHLWGFASLIPAFVECYLLTANLKFKENAVKVSDYIMKYSSSGEYFAPIILNSTKEKFDSHFYPRSDAWVLHALAELNKIDSFTSDAKNVCRKSYAKIEKQDYSGLENHVVTFRMKVFSKIVRLVLH